ncbi:MAG: VWA domain-containing protein, partial [Myxococcales bacterium]|nr:VWA domain-containing protein [Myxococcales bacterium]
MPGPAPGYADASGEGYAHVDENALVAVADAPRSTFAIDVDTASMSNVRRFLEDGQLPPADAVRVEEMINYFDYAYPEPTGDVPFAVVAEAGPSPFHADRRLIHLGLQGRHIADADLPRRNLIFLIDTSGSMTAADKLPLLKQGMSLMVERLTARDRVGIVAYAGSVGVVLPPTTADHKDEILAAIARLESGGSTNGAGGIQTAYQLAREHFDAGGINRVLLATDGDFNVGVSSQDGLVELIEQERDSGVYLTVLGFGTGNLQDAKMEALADHGNGNYGYIDSAAEARKLLVEQAGGTLVTIAKDVKVQVEFDPAQVASYRLIGYENRVMAAEDFRDDAKDAGELGAGHTVTALYEVEPAAGATAGAPLATLRLRYVPPTGGETRELAAPIVDDGATLATTSADFRFAAGVAGFGMLLRGSANLGDATWA